MSYGNKWMGNWIDFQTDQRDWMDSPSLPGAVRAKAVEPEYEACN